MPFLGIFEPPGIGDALLLLPSKIDDNEVCPASAIVGGRRECHVWRIDQAIALQANTRLLRAVPG